jgi:hypothetical protein
MARGSGAGRTENQRQVFEFLATHFKSQEPFTKSKLQGVTTWEGTTFPTYWSKLYQPFCVPAEKNAFRVSEAFRAYANWKAFRAHVTQVRSVADYTVLRHDSVLIFEFFMPLTNESQLRTTLDALFYEDTILTRLKVIGRATIEHHFDSAQGERDDAYFARLCKWIEKRFVGYSVMTVDGRFRAQDLMPLAKAAEIAESGDRYLIDETTAIVRFIFPCGNSVTRPLGALDLDEPASDPHDTSGEEEAKKIRWFFNALFVRGIIQAVNGEAEIWMVESGLQNRLHIWRVIEPEASD